MSEPTKRERMVAAKPAASAVSEQEKAPKERRRIMTLAELGPRLPIGIDAGTGALVKDIAHRTWKTKDERELGKLKRPKMNMATYVGMILSYLYSKVGPHEFSAEMKLDERHVRLTQMYMPDIFYMYVWLRVNVIGEKLKMNITCPSPSCQTKFAYTGDLNTLEVVCANDPKDLEWTYKLKDPIEIRKQTVTEFKMGQAIWGALESTAGDVNNEAIGKIVAVKGSVRGLNDQPNQVQLSDSEIDELSKRDLEAIVAAINNDHFGPKMAIEGECPSCHTEFLSAIDWRYESFFSSSSQ